MKSRFPLAEGFLVKAKSLFRACAPVENFLCMGVILAS